MGFNAKFALQKILNGACPVWVTSRHSGTPIYGARLAAVALITRGERRPPSAIGLGPLKSMTNHADAYGHAILAVPTS
jgi:hypothetical protein